MRRKDFEALGGAPLKLRAVEAIKNDREAELPEVMPKNLHVAERLAKIGYVRYRRVVDQHFLGVCWLIAGIHVVGQRRL